MKLLLKLNETEENAAKMDALFDNLYIPPAEEESETEE